MKHLVDGKNLNQYLLEKYKDKKKARAEYSRCLWIMKEKGLTPDEALSYHRIPKNPNWKWIKKVSARRRSGIDKKLLEMPSNVLVELGHDKMTKYFYGSKRLYPYCLKKGLNYKAIITIKKTYGGSIKDIVDNYRKGKKLSWYKQKYDKKEKEPVKLIQPVESVWMFK